MFAPPPVGTPEFVILHQALDQYVSDLSEVVSLGAPPEVEKQYERATEMLSQMSGALAALA